MAGTVAKVEVAFESALLLQVVFNSQDGFPLATALGGERIGKTIGDVLLSTRRVKVGKIFRGIPAFEPLGLVFPGKRLGPGALAFNEML